jgi:hypothetical protein
MNKITHGLALTALLTMLLISLSHPNSSIMWLASTSGGATLMRAYLAGLALVLLCTNPPRHQILRALAGGTGVFLLGWAGYGLYANQMQIFDGLLYLSVGFIFAVTALEREPYVITLDDQEYSV